MSAFVRDSFIERAYGFTMHLLPKDDESLAELRKHARLLATALPHLDALLADQDIEQHVAAIRELEAEGGRQLRHIGHTLRDTFITPLDRNGLLGLAHRLDEVLDTLDAVAFRLSCYRVTPLNGARELARSMRAGVETVVAAVDLLAAPKQRDLLMERCAELAAIERRADDQLRTALVELFSTERTAAALIQHKDLYELFEAVTDRCWEVAEALEDLLLDA